MCIARMGLKRWQTSGATEERRAIPVLESTGTFIITADTKRGTKDCAAVSRKAAQFLGGKVMSRPVCQQNEYQLTEFGKELVEALPDRKKVEAVKRKWRRRIAQGQHPKVVK